MYCIILKSKYIRGTFMPFSSSLVVNYCFRGFKIVKFPLNFRFNDVAFLRLGPCRCLWQLWCLYTYTFDVCGTLYGTISVQQYYNIGSMFRICHCTAAVSFHLRTVSETVTA